MSEEKKKLTKEERQKVYIESLQNRLKNHKTKRDNLVIQVGVLNSKIQTLNHQISYNKQEIAYTENLIKNLEYQISHLLSQK